MPRRGPHRSVRAAAGALLCLVVLAGCGGDGDDEPASEPSTPQTTVATSTSGPVDDGPRVGSVIAASVQEPIALVPRAGDPDHLWLAERSGRIERLSVADGGETLEPAGATVLDLSDRTTTDAERGLLDIAFSPDGSELYVSFTDPAGNSRVEAYPVGAEDEIDPRSGELLYTIDQPYPNHNGGNLEVDAQGTIWFGLGDGGAADDPENRAQDPSTDLGKILRIDPETGESEIVVSGVRNPWRFAFGPTGGLWVADVGQRDREEVSFLRPDEIDGANLGWSGYEGSQPYLDGDGRRPDDAVAPIFDYTHDDGNCSITGGYEYQGDAIEGLPGAFLFADYCAGRVRAVRVDEDGAFRSEYDLGIDVASPISFGQDAEGEPYVLSAEGDIVRIIPG